MATDYDVIAEQYRRAKLQPWRSLIETFSLLDLVGDMTGRSVVDLACGEGYYTRFLKRRGAGKVVGIDLSERMIDLALAEEDAHPLGIEYLVGDCRDLHPEVSFDLAVAAYLLNYAKDRVELTAMCRGVARCLTRFSHRIIQECFFRCGRCLDHDPPPAFDPRNRCLISPDRASFLLRPLRRLAWRIKATPARTPTPCPHFRGPRRSCFALHLSPAFNH
jgi:SAM-dependent methyltransferase